MPTRHALIRHHHRRHGHVHAMLGLRGTALQLVPVCFSITVLNAESADINACLTQACHANATCTDLAPPSTTRTCACNAGFEGSGLSCLSWFFCTSSRSDFSTDINACLTQACHANATCTDQAPPSTTRTCACNAGFEGDAIAFCSG